MTASASCRPLLRLLLTVAFVLVLQPAVRAMGQQSGILSIALSHNVNWMPESDSFATFRSNNSSEASSLASLGSEVVLGYEIFPWGVPNDSVRIISAMLQAGYLQRGYRVTIKSGSTCLSDEGYNVRTSHLRVALFGRNHIPLSKQSTFVAQLGAAYGHLLSVSDNVTEVQFCDVPTEVVDPVMPASFIEAGAGVGIQQKIGSRLVGNVDLLFFMPLLVSESETRPASETNVRSLLIDVATPNLAITLGVGWVL